MQLHSQKGQSLVELIIGVAVGLLFITGAIGIITLSLRIDTQNTSTYSGSELAEELLARVSVTANDTWHAIYDTTHSSDGLTPRYHLSTTARNFFDLEAGPENVTVNGVVYSRHFIVEDVYRDANDEIVTSGGTLDPSTLKITATVDWVERTEPTSVSLTRYIARIRNREMRQTDWSDGVQNDTLTYDSPLVGFASSINVHYASSGYVSISNLSSQLSTSTTTNIDSNYRWAWSDVFGWLDFYGSGNVLVTSTQVTGFVTSQVGTLALHCSTTPNGNICGSGAGQSNFGVANDGTGILSGMAWSDMLGWVSFSGTSPAYGVTIDSNGYFNGWAWSDVAGWISFNCANDYDPNTAGVQSWCSTVDYKVRTNWGTPVSTANLVSVTFDSGVDGGAALNTLTWQGEYPAGTLVQFQIATSNCDNGATNAPDCDSNVGWGGSKSSGDGAFLGPDGSASTRYQPASDNVQVRIERAYHNNRRFFKYKLFLTSNPDKTLSPEVEDVYINWSL